MNPDTQQEKQEALVLVKARRKTLKAQMQQMDQLGNRLDVLEKTIRDRKAKTQK